MKDDAQKMQLEAGLERLLQAQPIDKDAIITLLMPRFRGWAILSASKYSNTSSTAFFNEGDCFTLALGAADKVLSSETIVQNLQNGTMAPDHLIKTIRRTYNFGIYAEIRKLTSEGSNFIQERSMSLEHFSKFDDGKRKDRIPDNNAAIPGKNFSGDLDVGAAHRAIGKAMAKAGLERYTSQYKVLAMVLNNEVRAIRGESTLTNKEMIAASGLLHANFYTALKKAREKLERLKPRFLKASRGEINWQELVEDIADTPKHRE